MVRVGREQREYLLDRVAEQMVLDAIRVLGEAVRQQAANVVE